MRKGILGVAAAALLTIGVAGTVSADTVPLIDNGNAWVINTPDGATYGWIPTGYGDVMLVDNAGALSLNLGWMDMAGAGVLVPAGDGADVIAAQ